MKYQRDSFIYALLALAFALPIKAATTTLPPSGGDDTARLLAACKAGPVRLEDGVYHVTSWPSSCNNVSGVSTDAATYWYYGRQPTTKIMGTIVVPSPGPAIYQGFTISPPAGQDGIAVDGVQGLTLNDISVVPEDGVISRHCVNMTTHGGANQTIKVRGGTYQHCGGWCFYVGTDPAGGWTSDSGIEDAGIANCLEGGIFVSYGDGWKFVNNRIEDFYTKPGVALYNAGGFILSLNSFDLNYSDIILNNSWGTMVGNKSTQNQGGVFLDLDGDVTLVASGNLASYWDGPSYLVRPNGRFWGGIYDPVPTYADQHSRDVLAGHVR